MTRDDFNAYLDAISAKLRLIEANAKAAENKCPHCKGITRCVEMTFPLIKELRKRLYYQGPLPGNPSTSDSVSSDASHSMMAREVPPQDIKLT
jgi:hypothetical protein